MKIFSKLFILYLLFSLSNASNSNLFREYIGAEFNNVKFSDVPINPNVDFHFILTFATDYDTSSSPAPTNGKFNVFWDSKNLNPSHVSSIKAKHPNVKVALSIGGFLRGGGVVYFKPLSVKSWVSNAVSSPTRIIKQYNVDGIDISYIHYPIETETFTECIKHLISTPKRNRVISFASIAPFDTKFVQWQYHHLWTKHGNLIDYVNFQFYAYDERTNVSEFLGYFDYQTSYYNGSKVLVSLVGGGSGGLTQERGFFTACSKLKSKKQLHGIFTWSADVSKANGTFLYEKKAQALLAKK